MRRHLSPDDVLALAEGHAAADVGHVAQCEACRQEVESLRSVMLRVRRADVPEPSPLFWDHLSRRIHDAVAQEGPEPRPSEAWWRWWATAVPLTAAVALALSVMVSVPEVTRAPAPVTWDEEQGLDLADVMEPEWQFLVGLLESAPAVAEEDLPSVDAGDAELIVGELDAGEQAALLALLEDEVGETP
jgi:hypothetical protein